MQNIQKQCIIFDTQLPVITPCPVIKWYYENLDRAEGFDFFRLCSAGFPFPFLVRAGRKSPLLSDDLRGDIYFISPRIEKYVPLSVAEEYTAE